MRWQEILRQKKTEIGVKLLFDLPHLANYKGEWVPAFEFCFGFLFVFCF